MRRHRPRSAVRLLAAVAVAVTGPGAVAAQPAPSFEDRNFAIDLYSGSVVGSVRMIGLGGASVALAEGSAAALSNAAAPAVRRTTRRRRFDWSFHLDAQTAAFADDFDNNGMLDHDGASSKLASLGLVLQHGRWGVGLTLTTSSTRIVTNGDDEGDELLEPQASVARLMVARSFAREAHTVGVGLRFGSLSLVRPRRGPDDFALFSIAGPSAEVGWVWRPPIQRLRLGAGGALPVRGLDVTVKGCDPLDCEGYVLPEHVEVPWTIAVGGAYRFASTPWNTRVDAPYRDERAMLVTADLVVTGAVRDGHGLEAFARHRHQPSGRNVVFSPRLGTEVEAIPGWLRLRAGTYWEPPRFADVRGRLHGTAGFDLRLFEVPVGSRTYRPQLSMVLDMAERYGNFGVSIGFWR